MLPFLSRHTRGLARLKRSHPLFRPWTFTTIALVFVWIYAIIRGERRAFREGIAACDWQSWESWEAGATPHRAVLIADPQLVDPHTYPGRPWPLSTLTEQYTDRYMARSFRMINEQLDPDSVVFLGDMFDGGREWSFAEPRPLNKQQAWIMSVKAPNTKYATQEISIDVPDTDWSREVRKREIENVTESRAQPSLAERAENDVRELLKFKPGEDGRWTRYGQAQWDKEYGRFGHIFLSEQQLYPASTRYLTAVSQQDQDEVSVHNGATARSRREYGVYGGKTKTVLASLPGNHDLGFGTGVQLPTRARYRWHFGDLNRVDILGNHTFVSIDALSLAAWSQFEADGAETQGTVNDRRHIYAAAQSFLDALPEKAGDAIDRELAFMFDGPSRPTWRAGVVEPQADVRTNFSKPFIGATDTMPIILLSHVPLYRAPDTSCGPLRERGQALHISGGYQYQNVLTSTLSTKIIQGLSTAAPIAHIFSGDDHDYCNVTHHIPPSRYSAHAGEELNIVEETVKSFSWAMGVRRPGFQLVSMWNPIDDHGESIPQSRTQTIQTHLCLLPDQLAIFIEYAMLAGITIVVLLLRAIIVSARTPVAEDEESEEEKDTILHSLLPDSFKKMNGYNKLSKGPSKHRHRASSTSLKPTSNTHLGVQRSASARARSVSPGYGLASPFNTPNKAPLIDQAGYYPPAPSEDEESMVGDMDYLDEDSQAKWRPRSKPKGKVRRAWDEFTSTLSLVAVVAGSFYVVIIRTG